MERKPTNVKSFQKRQNLSKKIRKKKNVCKLLAKNSLLVRKIGLKSSKTADWIERELKLTLMLRRVQQVLKESAYLK